MSEKSMQPIEDFIRRKEFLWEIPKGFREGMRVPARFYASEKMIGDLSQDESLKQLVNLTFLPGIQKYSLAMPDIHEGYGAPIGGVFAVDAKEGVISPGAVGYDVNCGVRLLTSGLEAGQVRDRLPALAEGIYEQVPSGLGRGRGSKLSRNDLDKILAEGSRTLLEKGWATEVDIENCEENGGLPANPEYVSETAKKRGTDHLGTLGSGNHFLEIQRVEEIFDQSAAEVFGLFPGELAVMIHTGSRGLGHQVATDYIRLMLEVMAKYNIVLPDKELAAAPFKSEEGQKYFRAMAGAANFAWANRQAITYYVRRVWEKEIGRGELNLLYDVAHNMAKEESGLIVHRKGATRAFPTGHPAIPGKYRSVGQPVLIPGSMGTSSYVLRGTEQAEESFYSACHGAGRRMSRHEAARRITGRQVIDELGRQGVLVKSYSLRGLAEEAPLAYKDVDEVVDVVDSAGLAKKVARLVPLAVIKGE